MDKLIRTVIVDDEALARANLRVLLDEDPEVVLLAECRNGEEALDSVARESPELLFLDVQMPGMDGFEVLRRLSSPQMPLIVFVTAYDEYALRAFEANAVDYLLKPFTDQRFHQALARAKQRLRQQRGEGYAERLLELLAQLPGGAPARRIAVHDTGRIRFVDTDTVRWIKGAGNYVELHTAEGSFLHRETLTTLEGRLDGRFARIHRSYILNVDHIRELRSLARGDYLVLMDDGAKLRLSRNYRARVLQLLGGAAS